VEHTPLEQVIVGVDPGTAKFGLAVLDKGGVCLERYVASTADFTVAISALAAVYAIELFVLGDRTGAGVFRSKLQQAIASDQRLAQAQIAMVDEHLSSVQGRRLYLLDHRKGWRRYVPLGLRTPAVPFDHYVAEVLARRYLAVK